MLNLIIPFVIPEEIEIGDFNSKDFDPNTLDLSQYGRFLLDDKPINFSKESFNLDNITDRLLVYHKGESFNVNEILEGKLSGRTIALGDSISVLIKLDKNSLELFTEGEHTFKIESELITNLDIAFELNESNMDIKFDPVNA